MDKNDDVIEILDDVEIDTPINNSNNSFNDHVQVDLNSTQTIATPINAHSSVDDSVGSQPDNNFGVSASNDLHTRTQINQEVKKLEEVKYDPIEPEKEEIRIEAETQDDNSKSGLGFVIVLFVLLAAFIIALPYISKLF